MVPVPDRGTDKSCPVMASERVPKLSPTTVGEKRNPKLTEAPGAMVRGVKNEILDN